MKSNYKRLGDYIQEIDVRNRDDKLLELWGVSIEKKFIKSVANIIGTDLAKYKIVKRNQFVCSLMQVSRDEKIPIALWSKTHKIIVSPAYKVFEIIRQKDLLSEYLNLWFRRTEFDREASYYGVGGVRGSLEWNDFCDLQLPIPSLDEQQKIVDAYNVIENRIALKRKINDNLKAQARAIFKAWFVDFKPFQSQMQENSDLPQGWRIDSLSTMMSYAGGQQPSADKFIFEPQSGYVRLIQIRDYETDKYATYIPISKKNKLCSEMDIMIARYGVSLGRICFGLNGAYNVALAKVTPKKKFYREFLRCYLNTLRFYNEINGSGERSAQQGFNQSGIDDFSIVIPLDSVLIDFEKLMQPLFKSRLQIRQDLIFLEYMQNTLIPMLLQAT